MDIFAIISSVFFVGFAASIMSYVAMATPIGPWVELILVLSATLLFRLCFWGFVSQLRRRIALVTIAGGIAGIVAVSAGFVFPTLYFLDEYQFTQLLQSPGRFIAFLGGGILAGGSFAFFITHFLRDQFLLDDTMRFPIGQMVYKAVIDSRLSQVVQLVSGFFASIMYGLLQVYKIIPTRLQALRMHSWRYMTVPAVMVRLDLLPMFLAIGFIAGHVLTVPLMVGSIAKAFLLPVLGHYFPEVTKMNLILGFGTGLILQGAVLSFARLPHVIMPIWKKVMRGESSTRDVMSWVGNIPWLLTGSTALCVIGFLTYLNFSFLAQVYIMIFTVICIYQLLIIGGKIGLAPFGRFATFVMVPGMLMFGFNALQVTSVSLFVALAGGVAVDIMFGQKAGQLLAIDRNEVTRYQIWGLVVSAVAVSVVMWFLIGQFGLGSAQLVAQRAQARALLVNGLSFNGWLIGAGVLFGCVLYGFGINTALVFTGLLFPYDFSFMLIAGGLMSYLVHDKEYFEPFASGVFAANSLWMVVRALIGM
jgi:hypothetical protein